MTKIVSILLSDRLGSNSIFAASEFQKLLSARNDIELQIIDLTKMNITDYVDQREHTQTASYPNDDFIRCIKSMLDAEAIVIFTPIYWCSYPAKLHKFFERFSEALRRPELNFAEKMRGKIWSSVIVSGEDPSKYAESFWGMQDGVCSYLKLTLVRGPWFVAYDAYSLERSKSQEVVEKLKIFSDTLFQHLNLRLGVRDMQARFF